MSSAVGWTHIAAEAQLDERPFRKGEVAGSTPVRLPLRTGKHRKPHVVRRQLIENIRFIGNDI